MYERKAINIKQPLFIADDSGILEGYASIFNHRDLDGDIILPGAFKNTLDNIKGISFLWQHNEESPIGTLQDAYEDTKGLKIIAQLQLFLPKTQDIYQMVKTKMIRGLSIGFSINDCFYSKDTRYIKSAKLYEISLVTMPANKFACVENIKGQTLKMVGDT